MTSLAVPLIIVCATSGALAIATYTIARCHRRVALAAALAATGGLLLNALLLQDNVVIASVLPVQDAIIYGNAMLPLTAILAAAAWVLLPGPAWQRWFCTVALLAIAGWRVAAPLLRPAPVFKDDRWTQNVCRQSSLSSCSAAAAATVLRDAGIDTSEREMAGLCFTTVEGTTNLGLYRGLRIKAREGVLHIVPVRATADVMRRQNIRRCIFSITSNRDNVFSPIGKHSVVLFGFNPDGSADIGDPFSGRQQWSLKQFDALWPGSGFAIWSQTENAERTALRRRDAHSA